MSDEPRLNVKTLQVMALLYHASDPHYGLSIGKATGLGNGTLYPILDKLEDAGLIAGEWEDIDPVKEGRRPRRYYQLTAEGIRAFEHERQKVFGGLPEVQRG